MLGTFILVGGWDIYSMHSNLFQLIGTLELPYTAMHAKMCINTLEYL